MELKCSSMWHNASPSLLLIVPYGIEICVQVDYLYPVALLLIVPYGIEIVNTTLLSSSNSTLLIVPYGIEI